jgi:tetratricopeptide (TPR) repeat protein
MKLGEFEDANATISRAIAKEPRNANHWATQSIVLFSWDKYEEALEAIDKSLNLDPLESSNWQMKGLILQTLGRNEESDAANARAQELAYSG